MSIIKLLLLLILFGCKKLPQNLLEARKRVIIDALKSDTLPLDYSSNTLTEIIRRERKQAASFFYSSDGKPLLTEVFLKDEQVGTATKVLIYNFARNSTLVALVDPLKNSLLSFNEVKGKQPDLPLHLKDLATFISLNSRQVKNALGRLPQEAEVLMAGTKTSLNRSRCEQSRHLCVAPTIVTNGKALWSIVDLTDLKVVGIQWSNVGALEAPSAEAITERSLQHQVVMSDYCRKLKHYERLGWSFDYQLTGSDGVELREVIFKSKPYLTSIKLVDWHVNYSNSEGFGYSDAVGCPQFSHAAVSALHLPTFTPLKNSAGVEIGFELSQHFVSEQWPSPCNYNYAQTFQFYNDGKFNASVSSLGRGCGNDGTYRPVIRVAFANEELFFQDNVRWGHEGWRELNELNLEEKRVLISKGTSIFNTTFSTPGFFYITKRTPSKDEGESEMITIGPCCNTDYRQGPESFIDSPPEELAGGPLTLWYVPQLKNNDTEGKEACWAKSYVEDGIYRTVTFPCTATLSLLPDSALNTAVVNQ